MEKVPAEINAVLTFRQLKAKKSPKILFKNIFKKQ